ncbi:MAG: glutamate--tRNA ligase [Bacilli bacterium]|nr:glutamate--tRNA ligase [Bacilli bacterium]
MNKYEKLANVIFPDVTETIEDLEKRYPARNLPEGAEVTRFAPSPTGFLHLGSLFTSMVAKKVAFDTKGVFYIRLEDTDTKREVSGSGKDLLVQLNHFNVTPDEGYLGDDESGNYGPYKQSDREKLYRTVIKSLMIRGRAYPCFCTPEELEEIRNVQTANKEIPGYYGKYAKYRDLDSEEAIKRIEAGDKYVIRFRSEGDHNNKVTFHDEIRGDIAIAQNDQDIVILKGDGLPTYHFAHACDDHFMRTTTVIRGEEWVSSTPIHLDLFEALNFKLPKYAHLPVIMKIDENGSRRKLSKRKDPEASVAHLIEEGFPVESLQAYLMSIANSNFEEWTAATVSYNPDEFKFSFNKMSLDGVLFDQDKLNFFSKEIIARFTAEDLANRVLDWASKYDEAFYNQIKDKKDYLTAILNIERGGEKPRKDYAKYSDIYPIIRFFFNDQYEEIVSNGYPFNELMNKQVIAEVLKDFADTNDYSLGNDVWFGSVKALSTRHQFAENNKMFKANKEAYLGHSGDVAEMIRVALTGSKNSPNLYFVIQILGKEEVNRRINKAIEKLN